MGFLNNIFGDQQLNDIDRQIEDIIAAVPVRDYNADTSETDASELIHQVLAIDDKFANKEDIKKNPFYKDFDDHSGIMNEVSTLLDKLVLQPERSARYRTYEELYASIPMIKKMMNVWLANLVQKNPVSGKSIMIKDRDEDTQESSIQDEDYKNRKLVARLFVDELLEFFDFVVLFQGCGSR